MMSVLARLSDPCISFHGPDGIVWVAVLHAGLIGTRTLADCSSASAQA